jgi:uncharacterized protein (TIGR02266 family)
VKRETLRELVPILEREPVEVEICETAEEAARRSTRERFQLVICGYPLPDWRLRDFVTALRVSGGASRDASLVMMTESRLIGEARAAIDRGSCLMFSGDDRAAAIAQGAAELLQVAPRHAPRIATQLRVRVRDAEETFAGWVVNLSRTGMLVTDSPMMSVGARCTFEFTLPNGDTVRGSAVVVRHAAPRREKVTGFALRFVEFEGEGRSALEHWCEIDGD